MFVHVCKCLHIVHVCARLFGCLWIFMNGISPYRSGSWIFNTHTPAGWSKGGCGLAAEGRFVFVSRNFQNHRLWLKSGWTSVNISEPVWKVEEEAEVSTCFKTPLFRFLMVSSIIRLSVLPKFQFQHVPTFFSAVNVDKSISCWGKVMWLIDIDRKPTFTDITDSMHTHTLISTAGFAV